MRQFVTETGISKTSVHRYLQLFDLKPHRTESFKLSTDAFFIEKLPDVVGLYLNSPGRLSMATRLFTTQAIRALQPGPIPFSARRAT